MSDLYIFIPYGYSFHSPHPSGSGRVADVGVWLQISFISFVAVHFCNVKIRLSQKKKKINLLVDNTFG